jgi:transposase
VQPAGAPLGQAVLLSAQGTRGISDAEWERIRPLLPAQKPLTGRPRHDHRSILSGIVAVVFTGASWREMPAEYGKWETAYKRYRLWCAEGRWQRLLEVLDPGSVASQHAATSGP